MSEDYILFKNEKRQKKILYSNIINTKITKYGYVFINLNNPRRQLGFSISDENIQLLKKINGLSSKTK
jgi:hypothetical protein